LPSKRSAKALPVLTEELVASKPRAPSICGEFPGSSGDDGVSAELQSVLADNFGDVVAQGVGGLALFQGS